MQTARATVVGLAVVLTLSWSPGAGAHSTLIGGCPGPGDIVNELTTIELLFGSEIVDDGLAKLELTGDNGRVDLDVGPTTFADELTLTADVLADLDPGRYIVRYMVTSIDGDLNDGGFEFTLDPDADQDAAGCAETADGGSGVGGLVLLGVGVVAVVALGLLLRTPRRARS